MSVSAHSTMVRILFTSCAFVAPSQAFSQELGDLGSVPTEEIEYSPFINDDFPNQVFFGDTHLHTAYSADAGLVGAILTPVDAYRFAKGEEVMSSNGVPARLQQPLDWLVVTDHAENLGLPIALEEDSPILRANDWGRKISEIYAPRTDESRALAYDTWMQDALNIVTDPLEGTGFSEAMWPRITQAAKDHNQPGVFTAMIGFEWTSGPNGNNLHRNVIFRDGKAQADQIIPLSAYDTEDPEKLWDWLENYEALTGGRVLAIPHNGNLSNGLMFDDVTMSGKPIDRAYAERRQRWEPIYEITQIKGDGETHPLLSPRDEFADYGTWDKGSFGPEPKTEDMLPKEYARSAWKRGLTYEDDFGVNPFKFGVLGSTDSHTGLSTAEESNFFGKVSLVEPSSNPHRFEERITGRFTPDDPTDDLVHADGLASGLAAVWARENTRESIWDALMRKEVFATTGTRIRVRVFAGFDFVEPDLTRSDFAKYGYEKGVPMGGDLTSGANATAPKLLVRAVRDPNGANLDRIQIVKGWMTESGALNEQVYDVAWSDDRTPDSDNKLPPVGNTVDVDTATYRNSIGAPFLEAFWEDPDFEASQRAFYYVRVLEIPTPRWTTFDALVFGVDRPNHLEAWEQERAYSSPIWVTPE